MKRTTEELDKAAAALQQKTKEEHAFSSKKAAVREARTTGQTPTLAKEVLDLDSEKFCSVSLCNINVYACLVCGKYFQGRGRHSHAYAHSLEALHHVFFNLLTEKVYCLPDGYEIDDPSLDGIRRLLHPRFTGRQVRILDSPDCTLPGMVGLDNIKETDFVNVVIQSLMRVTLLRDFFLISENYQMCKSALVHRFGELTRRIWHPQNFKGQVSPHRFLQAVMASSKQRFRTGLQSDPVEFMSWLLITLHVDLGGTKEPNSSVIYRCFRGELEVTTEFKSRKTIDRRQDSIMSLGEVENSNLEREASKLPFLMLGLDFPLFNEVMEETSGSVVQSTEEV